MNVCAGIFGRVFGHKYRGRYSTSEAANPLHFRAEHIEGQESIAEFLRQTKLYSTTHVWDICERCGVVKGKL